MFLLAAHAFLSTLCCSPSHQGALTAALQPKSSLQLLSSLGVFCVVMLWLPLWSAATLIRSLFLFSLAFWPQKVAVNEWALPLLRGGAHLLGEAHDLQPVALPDRSVGAGVHQLVHLLHRLDGGDLEAKRHQTGSARCQVGRRGHRVYWNVIKLTRSFSSKQSFEERQNSLKTSEMEHSNLIACFVFLQQDKYKMGKDVPVRNLIKLQL